MESYAGFSSTMDLTRSHHKLHHKPNQEVLSDTFFDVLNVYRGVPGKKFILLKGLFETFNS